MNKIKKHNIIGEKGVIMMETLVTLPVYLIMIVCLFWLGEICLTRLTLTHGERLRLWEYSNRHIGSTPRVPFGAGGIFWFLPTAASSALQTGVTLTSETFPQTLFAGTWGQRRSGRMQIDTLRSNWADTVIGFFNPGAAVLGSGRQRMSARASNSNVALFSRSANTPRVGIYTNAAGWNDACQWFAMFSDWDIITPGGVAVNSLSNYTRNATYLLWSR